MRRAHRLAVQPDSIEVTVVAPPAITVNNVTVGSGLQQSAGLYLPLSNHGGVTVVVKC